MPLDHPKRDRERGRIWRVVYTGARRDEPRTRSPRRTSPKPTPSNWSICSPDANITVRTLATNELVNRIGKPCIPIVLNRVNDSHSAASQRAHGLWVLERLGALDDTLVQQLLNDPDRIVRIQAIRAGRPRRFSGTSVAPARQVGAQKLADDDAFVRRAAADCLGRHPEHRMSNRCSICGAQLRPTIRSSSTPSAWRFAIT